MTVHHIRSERYKRATCDTENKNENSTTDLAQVTCRRCRRMQEAWLNTWGANMNRPRDRARVLTRLETPPRMSVRSPYYVVPVAWLEPRDGCATLDDAERHAQATWRSRGPVAVVQVVLQVASVDAEEGGP
jgi:hypothetical protein